MKKGMALEGYIQEDGTVRPMKQYDDTELRAKIQTNTDKIDNLQSQTNSIDGRVTYLETHGGAEDPTKADKVVEAVEGNLAGLDENGNLTDSGYAPSDFAPVDHSHSSITHRKDNKQATIYGYCDAYTSPYFDISLVDGIGNPQSAKSVNLNMNNIDNLARALAAPSSFPENTDGKLITSKAVYDALAARAPYYDGEVIIKHLDNVIPYPFDGDSEVRNSVIALYKAIPKNTYVLCRVTLDNRDYAGSEDEIVTVPAFAYAKEEQEQEDTWYVDIIFANGVKFTAGVQYDYAQYWIKTTNSFFS